ncbi:dTDP-4-dehydrorhamnose reductase [Oceanicella sp. SM1341]|uniref:dTDP-4-dehydrorhamnose reductase n=1 Tax=Oceanicella sp. SM1341 TaxID=1548889 RepID=UPI000E552CDB|nr:dTDP-4-dehydrorhamnose reductase [Oceanicella sp. SM1341]
MKVLVVGRSGQLGRALAEARPAGIDLAVLGREEADLARPDTLADAVARHAPALVVNAGAYTAVDRAEAEPRAAWAVNATGTGALARAAARAGAPFVHVSTDYVYDGSGEAPWTEADAPGPLGAYGASKLAGEYLAAAQNAAHVVLRTSWVFSSEGPGFVQSMLRLGAERDTLSVVADQVGRPTSARQLAAAIWQIGPRLVAGRGAPGTYNFSGGGPFVSRLEFAAEIFARAGMKAPALTPARTEDFPSPARRPLNSRLDLSALANAWGIEPADWRDELSAALSA